MWGKVVIFIVCLLAVYIALSMRDDFDPGTLKGKRVLITGTSTGIGEQLAYQYAKFGANIVITARREERLKEVVKKCRKFGSHDGIYEYVTADMSDLTSTSRVIKEAVKKLGGLDILVLNHAQYLLAPFTGSPENLTLFSSMLDINFNSFVHLTSHSLPYLRKSNGTIIAVSSLTGRIASPYNAIYASSKAAIDAFYHALQQEFLIESTGMSATVCLLGYTETGHAVKMTQDFGLGPVVASIPKATASEAAVAIIKAGVSRASRMYYLPLWRYLVIAMEMFPQFFEWYQVREYKSITYPDQ